MRHLVTDGSNAPYIGQPVSAAAGASGSGGAAGSAGASMASDELGDDDTDYGSDGIGVSDVSMESDWEYAAT